jgi:lycopene beta-cyclase
MKISQGFRLATVSLQYGERTGFYNQYLICFRNNYHFHQPESLGNRRIRNYNFGTNGEESFSEIIQQHLHKQKQKTKLYPVLQQHFIGWFIKSEQAVFNMEQATFHGFSVEQKEIPFYTCCPRKPSITEYTLFSHQHLKKGRMK